MYVHIQNLIQFHTHTHKHTHTHVHARTHAHVHTHTHTHSLYDNYGKSKFRLVAKHITLHEARVLIECEVRQACVFVPNMLPTHVY